MSVLASSILPIWLVFPVAAAAMFATAVHVVSLQRADVPSLRRRVRTGVGLTMLLVTALFAYGVGVAPVGVPGEATPAQARVFVLVWIGIIVLVAFAVLLAVVDAFLTFRDAAAARTRLRKEVGLRLRDDAAEVHATLPAGADVPATFPRRHE